MNDSRKIYKVSELTRLIRSTLEVNVGSVWIEGELSNVRRPSSGHYYLTIKDTTSQISGVLFRGSQKGLKFVPSDGVLVRVYGEISVYEPSGTYQIIIRTIEEGGKGALQEMFEKLKEKLKNEGLFEESRKKPLPLLPQHVGLVTSRTGAAIRDILNVVSRRFPNLHIVLAPVKVQGAGAADDIAEAIDLLNKRGGLDVMIVGRGGGSIEDLWCFNEEIVARAIARSEIPVISAVGHEIDFTISDFVADMRAPTPSAAAELVVGRKEQFQQNLEQIQKAVSRALQNKLLRLRNRLLAVSGSYILTEPRNMIKRYLQKLDAIEMHMVHQIRAALRDGAVHMESAGMKMFHAVDVLSRSRHQDIKRYEEQLKALSPLAVLSRGYSVTMSADGVAVRDPAILKEGQIVVTRVEKGSFESEVKEIK